MNNQRDPVAKWHQGLALKLVCVGYYYRHPISTVIKHCFFKYHPQITKDTVLASFLSQNMYTNLHLNLVFSL